MILWRPIEVINGVAHIEWRSKEKLEKIVVTQGKEKNIYTKMAPKDKKTVVE